MPETVYENQRVAVQYPTYEEFMASMHYEMQDITRNPNNNELEVNFKDPHKRSIIEYVKDNYLIWGSNAKTFYGKTVEELKAKVQEAELVWDKSKATIPALLDFRYGNDDSVTCFTCGSLVSRYNGAKEMHLSWHEKIGF